MTNKSLKTLLQNLLDTCTYFRKLSSQYEEQVKANKLNAASATRANRELISRKINLLKKEIHCKMDQPAYRVSILINGEPNEGFFTNISKEDIAFVYEITSQMYNVKIQILEIQEILPYVSKSQL